MEDLRNLLEEEKPKVLTDLEKLLETTKDLWKRYSEPKKLETPKETDNSKKKNLRLQQPTEFTQGGKQLNLRELSGKLKNEKKGERKI